MAILNAILNSLQSILEVYEVHFLSFKFTIPGQPYHKHPPRLLNVQLFHIPDAV